MAKKVKYISGVGSRLSSFQVTCDVIGMTEIPVVSQGADVISGVISLATGDYIGAGLSAAGLLPGVGQLTGAAKIGRNAKKAFNVAENSAKSVDKVSNSAQKSAKLLELTKRKTISNQPAKRNAVVDAKPAPKDPIKEKETIHQENIDTDVKKLDIRDGKTNPLEGIGLNNLGERMLDNNTNSQASNYRLFFQAVEKGKQYYNPTSILPKNNPFGI